MAEFKDILKTVGNALEDISSLEVVTFKGTVAFEKAADFKNFKFDSLFTDSSGKVSIKLVALTKTELDGDTQAYLDQSASQTEVETHHKLWDSAVEKRTAIIQLIQSAATSALKA